MAEQATAPSIIDGHRMVGAGERIDVVNPYSDSIIGGTAEAGADIVARAMRAATSASAAWSDVPVADRAAILDRTAQQLEDNGPAIAATVTDEMGMPITLALATQSDLPVRVLRATAQAARDFEWSRHVDGHRLDHMPAGVVAAVTPWNMPVHQIIAKVSAALVAGCTVVLKPSEATPFDAVEVVEAFEAAGLPSGVLNLVQGTGAVTGSALVSSPGLAHVSFTGSVVAGRVVSGLAAHNLTRCTLELGGKSPAVILPDADLDVAVAGALKSALVNSGQACNATSRMVIPAELAGEIEDVIRRCAESFVVGDPHDPSTTLGPLASSRQLDRVVGYAQAALGEGGRLVAGTGKPEPGSPGCFMAPTVIADLPATARAVREEIFGPVTVLQTYRSTEEAVALANDSDFGLSAEVWAGSRPAAEAVAARLNVGQVKINGARTREHPTAPFGGVKNSGYGRELGSAGIAEFTEIRAVF